MEKKISVTKVFTFDSAHSLVDYGGKCSSMHGHTYRLEVTVTGRQRQDGIVMAKFDHVCLNDVMEQNPACENVALRIWAELEPYVEVIGGRIEKITLWETPASKVEITRGEEREEE